MYVHIWWAHTHMHTTFHRGDPHPYTYDFNLFALIIHNSINANKLTLSKGPKKERKSFYGFLWAPFMAANNNPVIIWEAAVGSVWGFWGDGARKTYQLRIRGINLSDFYVNSIHFIYSTKSYAVKGKWARGWLDWDRLGWDFMGRYEYEGDLPHRNRISAYFQRNFCAHSR